MDVGDFIAHPIERDRGLATVTVRDTYFILKFKIGHLNGPPLDPKDLPPEWYPAAKATFPRLQPKLVKDKTGLSPARSRKLHDRLMKHVVKKANGRFNLPDKISQEEDALFKCVASMLVPKAAYSGTKLVDEFGWVLQDQHVLGKDEANAFAAACQEAVILRAVATMHRASIRIDKTTSVELMAAHDATGFISVLMHTTVLFNGRDLKLAAPLFDTELPWNVACDLSLRTAALPWEFPIEYTKGKGLRPMISQSTGVPI
jgi:hypothetical protein